MYIVCLFLYGWLLLLFEMFYFKSFIKVARFFVTNCFVYVESFSSVWSIRCVFFFFFFQRGLEAGWLPINQPDQYQWGEGKRFVVNKIFSNFLMPCLFIVCHWQKKQQKAFSCWSPIESFPRTGTWWFVSLIITSAALSVSVAEQIYTHTHTNSCTPWWKCCNVWTLLNSAARPKSRNSDLISDHEGCCTF